MLTPRLRFGQQRARRRWCTCQAAAEAFTAADPEYLVKLLSGRPNVRPNSLHVRLEAQVYFRSISDLFAGCGRLFARALVTELLTPPGEGMPGVVNP